MNLDIDSMDINELKEVVKTLVMLVNLESDRITSVQERLLSLELKLLEKEEGGVKPIKM
ncbi:hypothetical protein ACD661_11685 [Legionella lytica]|uniref:Uncharacterized protein n=1 Tax=Legionella lytica TaxID=96232 RepID=A0ABW8D943_9GAMM